MRSLRPPQRPTLTLLRSGNAQPNRLVRRCWPRNNGLLRFFWRLTLPYWHSSNSRQPHYHITNQQQSIPADATPATEVEKAAPEPPIDLLDDEPEPTASEFVDFTYYAEVIPAGLERSPRDVEEPRPWTLTDDTARAPSDKRTQVAYDEYLHIGCYAFFDSCANAAVTEGMDTMSSGPPLSAEQTAAVPLIRAGHRTHTATEKAARTPLGFLRLIKGGQASMDADRVFGSSQNWPTSTSVAHALPRSPAQWMRYAKL
jgi:hypothetical protein